MGFNNITSPWFAVAAGSTPVLWKVSRVDVSEHSAAMNHDYHLAPLLPEEL
jgi:hypothetical protein